MGEVVAAAPIDQARLTRFVVPDLCNAPALSIVVLVGELLVLVLLFAGGPLTWEGLALKSLYVQWVVLMSAGALCGARPVFAKMGLARGALLAFVIIAVLTLLVSLGADRVVAGTLSYRIAPINWLSIAKQMGIACIIAGMVLRYFYVQQQLREQEQSELQSRIQALQSRIRPHFLFNSMNIIASLISVDPETAESVVEDLSELFRASLNDAGNQVLMTEELELCERYVRIEQLRLGDRLRVAWDIGEYPDNLKIPLLTLQPLLENAIYHGIQPLPDGGTIALTLRYDRNTVNVRITNPVPPPEYRALTQGNKMAVNNIRTRLNVLYNDAAELTAEIEGDLYVTQLRYPHPALDEIEPMKEVS
jgi:two-component system, LytTR family, sensor histidine kinase AlgZ